MQCHVLFGIHKAIKQPLFALVVEVTISNKTLIALLSLHKFAKKRKSTTIVTLVQKSSMLHEMIASYYYFEDLCNSGIVVAQEIYD